jgi:hypothetical protein
VTCFSRDLSTILRRDFRPNLTPLTDGNREAVEQVLALRVGLFEKQTELMKEAVGQISHTMKSATKTRAAQHARHQASLPHKGATRFDIAAEVKSCRESSGNNFNIGKATAAVVTTCINSFQDQGSRLTPGVSGLAAIRVTIKKRTNIVVIFFCPK